MQAGGADCMAVACLDKPEAAQLLATSCDALYRLKPQTLNPEPQTLKQLLGSQPSSGSAARKLPSGGTTHSFSFYSAYLPP